MDAGALLTLAVRRLTVRDLSGGRHYALLAKESDPSLSGTDQILAIANVLLAAGRRLPGDLLDHYSILQVPKSHFNSSLLQKKYLDTIFLLNPSKNLFPFARDAFDLVRCAGYVLADPGRRKQYEKEIRNGELNGKKRFGNGQEKSADDSLDSSGDGQKNGVCGSREEGEGEGEGEGGGIEDENGAFWTLCPYCYHMYQYEKMYEDCCLLCQNCKRGFHAAAVALPQKRVVVDGAKYYYAFGFFPIGFDWESSLRDKKKDNVLEISDDNSEDNGDSVDLNVDRSRLKQEVGGEGRSEGVRMKVKRVARKKKKKKKRAKKIMDDGGVMASKKDGSDECVNIAPLDAEMMKDSSVEKEDVADASDAIAGAKMKEAFSAVREDVGEARTAEILSKKGEVAAKRVMKKVKSVPRNSKKLMGKLVRLNRVELGTVDELNAELREEAEGHDHGSTRQADIRDEMDSERFEADLSLIWEDDACIDLEEILRN